MSVTYMEPPVRITILIGHSVKEPLPEALDMAYFTFNQWNNSRLNIDLRLNIATLDNFREEVRRGCNILIFYCHGDEQGRLRFADQHVSYSDLGPEDFWNKLLLCMIFACHSEKFANALPCPWLAFTKKIDSDAPKGFIDAWIDHLMDKNIRDALDEAIRVAGRNMLSDFARDIKKSQKQIPEKSIEAGVVKVTCGSPGIFKRYYMQYDEEWTERVPYQGHKPFVGRKELLEIMLQIPTTYSDCKHQSVSWFTGEAGMGKSSLLREFCSWVKDTVFDESIHPTFLMQMNCCNFTNKNDLIRELIGRVAKLCKLENGIDSLDHLMTALQRVPGRHIWVLDDLTYLVDARTSDEGGKLVDHIQGTARYAGVFLYLYISARRATGINKKDEIPIKPFSTDEAIDLAKEIIKPPNNTFDTLDKTAIENIFTFLGKNTADFKKHLKISKELTYTCEEYAEWLREYLSVDVEHKNLVKKKIESELDFLKRCEEDDCFNYPAFFSICYRLLLRCSYFTHQQLKDWFPNEFLLTNKPISTDIAYRKGLDRLVNFDFISVGRDESNDRRYRLNPNQRGVFLALKSEEVTLPDCIPPREVQERISLAWESVNKGDLEVALRDFASIEGDYKDELQNDVKVIEHTISALYNKGVCLEQIGRNDKAIEAYDEVVRRYDSRSEAQIAELVASSLNNKGACLEQMGRNEEAIAAFDEVVRRYDSRGESQIAEQVALALNNKGVCLEQMRRYEEAIEAYNEVVRRYDNRSEALIAVWVASALYNKGVCLGRMGRNDDAIVAYDEVVSRYASRSEALFAERVALALYNKGVCLGQMGRNEEAIEVYDEVVRQYASRSEALIAEKVALALNNKGCHLEQMRRYWEAIEAYYEVARRYDCRSEAQIAKVVNMARHNTIICLMRLEEFNEAF